MKAYFLEVFKSSLWQCELLLESWGIHFNRKMDFPPCIFSETFMICNTCYSVTKLYMTLWPRDWSRPGFPVLYYVPVQFSPVTQSCQTLCDPLNRSMPGLPVHHQLSEFTQTHIMLSFNCSRVCSNSLRLSW